MNKTELLKVAKPIIFNTEMVRAILANRKTQTRRVIKNKRFTQWEESNFSDEFTKDPANGLISLSPRKAGDILYVRETWANIFGKFEYRVDFSESANEDRTFRYGSTIARWRPSIHMPKETARIFLKVTDVKIERVQDMTEEDAIKEGIRIGIGGMPYFSCRDAFAGLWDSLNLKRGYGWETNPWVWVISFEKIDGGAV